MARSNPATTRSPKRNPRSAAAKSVRGAARKATSKTTGRRNTRPAGARKALAPKSAGRNSAGRQGARGRAAGQGGDAIALLKADHVKVKRLLAELEDAQRPHHRLDLVASIKQELLVHAKLEEELFYPAFRAACEQKDDVKLYFEAREEHAVAEAELAQVEEGDPSTDEYAAKCKVLKDLIEHHIEEEEDEMFPKARRLMGRDQLVGLAQDMQQRKAELMGAPNQLENPAETGNDSGPDQDAHGFWDRIRAARQSQAE